MKKTVQNIPGQKLSQALLCLPVPPETYFLTQEDTIESITKMMLDQTQKHLEKYKTEILDFKVNSQPLTVHQFMTLSSIVQRESPVNDEDRQLVCGVLINRLNKQIPLQ